MSIMRSWRRRQQQHAQQQLICALLHTCHPRRRLESVTPAVSPTVLLASAAPRCSPAPPPGAASTRPTDTAAFSLALPAGSSARRHEFTEEEKRTEAQQQRLHRSSPQADRRSRPLGVQEGATPGCRLHQQQRSAADPLVAAAGRCHCSVHMCAAAHHWACRGQSPPGCRSPRWQCGAGRQAGGPAAQREKGEKNRAASCQHDIMPTAWHRLWKPRRSGPDVYLAPQLRIRQVMQAAPPDCRTCSLATCPVTASCQRSASPSSSKARARCSPRPKLRTWTDGRAVTGAVTSAPRLRSLLGSRGQVLPQAKTVAWQGGSKRCSGTRGRAECTATQLGHHTCMRCRRTSVDKWICRGRPSLSAIEAPGAHLHTDTIPCSRLVALTLAAAAALLTSKQEAHLMLKPYICTSS